MLSYTLNRLHSSVRYSIHVGASLLYHALITINSPFRLITMPSFNYNHQLVHAQAYLLSIFLNTIKNPIAFLTLSRFSGHNHLSHFLKRGISSVHVSV